MKVLPFIFLCVAGLLAGAAADGFCPPPMCRMVNGWPSWGRDIADTNFNPKVLGINKFNVHKLEERWRKDTLGTIGVSATPTTDGEGRVYVVDWHGNVWCLDEDDGSTIWRVELPLITGDPASVSRTSPAIAKTQSGREVIVLGDQNTPTLRANGTFCAMNPGACGASYYSFDRFTGQLLWRSIADAQPSAIITSSPTVFGQWIYTGISSSEPGLANFVPGYPCCFFRGSFIALDVTTGAIRWRHWNIPDNGGMPGEYSGASSWGSSPAVCPEHKAVFFGTSNLYHQPQRVSDCLNDPNNTPHDCLEPDVFCDALIKVNMYTGERVWARPFHGVDAWNVDCIPPPGPNNGSNCPQPTGPDFDVGHGPILYHNKCGEKVVTVIQKSGIVWSLYADTGETIWRTYVGPGSTLQNTWGSSFDGHRIYFSVGNFDRLGYLTLQGEKRCDGSWAAVDAFNGDVEWITPVPGSRPSDQCPDPVVLSSLSHILSDDEMLFTDRVGGVGNGDGDKCKFKGKGRGKGKGKGDDDDDDNDDRHHVWSFKSRRALGWDVIPEDERALHHMAHDDAADYHTPEHRAAYQDLLQQYRSRRALEQDIRDTPLFATAHGSVNAIRGVVFGGAMTGWLYAFDSDTGNIVWAFRCPTGSVYGGPAIDEHEKDSVYWGCGYGRLVPFFQGDRYVFAFEVGP